MKILYFLLSLLILNSCKDNPSETPEEIIDLRGDYFPQILENTQIKFTYTALNCRLTSIYDEGEAFWNFDTVKEEGGEIILSGLESIFYTRTTNGVNPELDTVYHYLKIIEDKNHIVNIVSSDLWSGITFKRFHDPGTSDTLAINYYATGIFLEIKKDVGIIKLKSNPQACVSNTFTLVE